jgi:signal transduction protein with GAF and PtsI domain
LTAKADRIKALINDPDLKEAFEAVRETYRDMIEETPVSDDTALLDIRKMLHLLREVESSLHRAIQQGHLADFRAAEQQAIMEGLDRVNGSQH